MIRWKTGFFRILNESKRWKWIDLADLFEICGCWIFSELGNKLRDFSFVSSHNESGFRCEISFSSVQSCVSNSNVRKLLFDDFFLYFSAPWDQNTPIGYLFEISFSTSAGECYFIINGAVLLIFISVCLHHQAFYQMFLHSINEFDRLQNKRNGKQHLCELIKFHCNTKEWVWR